ncbi:MAG: epimerase [Gemmatimonadetes bacterium]|nr:epimerase [Gemmatimonadota bacterium]
MGKILLTGAAGFVGTMLRLHWGDRFDLRLADVRPVDDSTFESVELDVADYEAMRSACEGIETVLHLAADPSPAAEFYDSLLSRNVIATYNAFEAARDAGCRRVVFASSVNAILGHEDITPVPWEAPVFPINVYGATKCWGEALGRVYAHSHRVSTICVRLGSPRFAQDGDWNPEDPSMGISPRDTAQLFARCVEADDIDFAIVHGISNHRHSWMDLEVNRQVLGYEPEDGTAFPKA